jgi:hypothetical protein
VESLEMESVKIPFKCGPKTACIVKKVILVKKDPNLTIHLMRNCIRCTGKEEPEFKSII